MTSNVSPSIGHQGHYSAFLNASGRVLYDVFIYPASHNNSYREMIQGGSDEPGFFIEVDANEVETLAKHLKRYKLRAKVGIRLIDDQEWRVWQAWPDDRATRREDVGEIHCYDSRAPEMGTRLVTMGEKLSMEAEEATTSEYDLRRMMLGVAEGQSEILTGSALPQESNIDYMGGIDFRKGCYVGQELTIRTHHTGVVRKRILPVQIYRDGGPPNEISYNQDAKLILPPPGSNISRTDKKGRSAGRWLGGVGNVGLALCRLEVMTDTILTSEGSQWSPEHEFKVAWELSDGSDGGEVKVRAFVPEWHRERAEAQSLHGNRNTMYK